MPVFASNWRLRTRSARVSASWMSISSNKSSHEAQRRLLPHPAKAAATSGVAFSTRESAAHAMQAGGRRERKRAAFGQCVRCNSSVHWQASASLFSGVRRACAPRRPATTSGAERKYLRSICTVFIHMMRADCVIILRKVDRRRPLPQTEQLCMWFQTLRLPSISLFPLRRMQRMTLPCRSSRFS